MTLYAVPSVPTPPKDLKAQHADLVRDALRPYAVSAADLEQIQALAWHHLEGEVLTALQAAAGRLPPEVFGPLFRAIWSLSIRLEVSRWLREGAEAELRRR